MKEFDFITNLPQLISVKDTDSVFVNFTHDLAKLVGWKSAENAYGKTDYDFPCKASEFASEFIRIDKIVLGSGKKMSTLDIQPYAEGWRLTLFEKTPIKDKNGNVVGTFNSGIDVTQISLFKAYALLYKLDNQLMKQDLKPASYILTEAHSPLPLTEKQENCLFLLIRGKSIKEIAKILGISPRTVESHMESIKNRLDCRSKSDIIEKAMDSGYLYYVPSSLQTDSFRKITEAIK